MRRYKIAEDNGELKETGGPKKVKQEAFSSSGIITPKARTDEKLFGKEVNHNGWLWKVCTGVPRSSPVGLTYYTALEQLIKVKPARKQAFYRSIYHVLTMLKSADFTDKDIVGDPILPALVKYMSLVRYLIHSYQPVTMPKFPRKAIIAKPFSNFLM
mgnify:CR=1 FL=1